MAASVDVLPDRYAAPRMLGRGGMADVFLAEDRELSRPVAVKVMRERLLGDRTSRMRFRREALTAARLGSHPHIVVIHDVGEWRGLPYIVMEAHTGGNVRDAARAEEVELETALGWLEQAADALDHAHAAGVVHRDVKPANLLIDERGGLQVTDFGIARGFEQTEDLTSDGIVLGTPGYLAPEQAQGSPATPASDRYALAVVAYELLTGRRPQSRREELATLPPAAHAAFERCLSENPSERHPDARAFVAELRAAVAARPAADARLAPEPPDTEPATEPAAVAAEERPRSESAAPPPADLDRREPAPPPRIEPRASAPAADPDPAPIEPPRWVGRTALVLIVATAAVVGGWLGFTYAISLLLIGLVTGALARLIRPGHTPIGGSATAALGATATLVVGIAMQGRADAILTSVVAVAAALVLIEAWWRFWRARARRRHAEPYALRAGYERRRP